MNVPPPIQLPSKPISIPGPKNGKQGTMRRGIPLSTINSVAKDDLNLVNKAITIIDQLLTILDIGKHEYQNNILIDNLLIHYKERKAFLTTKRDEITTFLPPQGGRRKRSTRKRNKRSKRSTRK